ncbi:hypothetical protein QJS10_CPB19g01032 [Acorus calamus]|uniref:Secreted protein n=1 Tax=Acorus calamus TaxID=4465 RepID=A0AAV9CFX0_ACOCL|nr:hypothetical protein QJS10_CPB19g01032 [Acorus calamus]
MKACMVMAAVGACSCKIYSGTFGVPEEGLCVRKTSRIFVTHASETAEARIGSTDKKHFRAD